MVVGGVAADFRQVREAELISVDPESAPVPSCLPQPPPHFFYGDGTGGYIKKRA